MLFQITTAGQALIQAHPTTLSLASAQLGSGYGYTLPSNPTGLTGSEVYATTVSDPQVVNPNTIKYTITLDSSTGPFIFGEIALYAGSTLFAVGVNGAQIDKYPTAGAVLGNSIRIDVFCTLYSGNYVASGSVSDSGSIRLPTLSTPDMLVPPTDAETNVYVINGSSPSDIPVLAYADNNNQWSFSDKPYNWYNGTVTSATSTTINVASNHDLTLSPINAFVIKFTSGSCFGYVRVLSAAAEAYFNVNTALGIVPAAGDTFVIMGPSPLASGISLLSQLHDCHTTEAYAPSTGQVLAWNSGDSAWEPANASAGIYHDELTGLEGGDGTHFYHLTAAQWLGLSTGNLAYLNVNQIFTASQTVEPVTLDVSSPGSVPIPANQSNLFYCVVNADLVLNTPSGLTDGQPITILFFQSSVGSKTVGFPPVFQFNGSSTINPTANSITVLSGVYQAKTSKIVCALGGGQTLKLGALSDVTIISPANGDSLIYESSTGTWVNGPLSSGLFHNALSGLQGGAGSEFYHLTGAQHTNLLALANNMTYSAGNPIGLNIGIAVEDVVIDVTSSTAIVLDASQTDSWDIVINYAGAVLIPKPINLLSGQTFNIQLTNVLGAATSITWDTSYKFSGGSVPALTATANAVDLASGKYNGRTGNSIIAYLPNAHNP